MERAEEREGMVRYTFYGAIATLLVVAIWGLAVFWIHTVTPGGADMLEMTYLGTVTIMSWMLVPLCWKRVRWSYLAGIGLIAFGLGGGAVIAAWMRVLFFSASIYNFFVILVYVIALAGLYFSFRSYRELPRVQGRKTVLGIGGIALVTVVVGAALWSSAGLIGGYMEKSSLQNIDEKLQNLETIDEKVQFLVRKGKIPSLVAGIVVNDSLVWAKAYGEQASLDTVCNIGSITKPFVATAVLQLCDRNLMDLDDDVNEYLAFNMRHPKYPNKPITIRMLLSHQSGLTHYTDQYRRYVDVEILDWLSENAGWDIVKHDPLPSFGAFLEGYVTPDGPYYSPDAWSSSEPGTEYVYSSPGYDTLGYIVERVTNQAFTDYLQENILDPLNMTSSGFSVSYLPEKQGIPHERIFGILSKTNVELPLWDRKRIGGGGMRSTVPDLAQFMIAHMNRGKINGFQLLKPETVELMHRQAVDYRWGDIFMVGYGLGLTLEDEEPWVFWGKSYDMHGAIGHGGTDFGYMSRMFFVKEEQGGYGIVFMTDLSQILDADFVWYLSIFTNIEDSLMQEATVMFTQSP